MQYWNLTTIFGLVVVCACGPDLPNKTVESEHFRYHYRPSDAPCPGLFNLLERHYGAVAAFLGIGLPSGTKVDYFKFIDDADVERNSCDGQVAACSAGTSVYTSEPIDYHELVHAYTFSLGDPPAFFSEGVAEALSCRYLIPPYNKIISETTPEGILEENGFRSVRFVYDSISPYDVAASFSRFLFDQYGPGPWRSLYSNLPKGASASTIKGRFQNAFGVSFDDAVAGWRTKLPMSPWQSTLCLLECSQDDVILPTEAPARRDGVASCLPEVVSFDVWEPGDVELTLSGAVQASIFPCTGSGSDWFVSLGLIGAPSDSLLKLEPGRYYLDISPAIRASQVEPFTVELRYGESLIGETCGTTTPLDVYAGSSWYIMASDLGVMDDYSNQVLPGAGDLVVRFRAVEPGISLQRSSSDFFDTTALTLCRGDLCPGVGREDCTELSGLKALEIVESETYNLVIDGASGEYGMWMVNISAAAHQ